MLGVITAIFHDRGYGFIIDEEWTQRYFHFTNLRCQAADLKRKSVVSFDAGMNGVKHTAENIMLNIIAGLRPGNYDEVLEMLEKYHQNSDENNKKTFAVQKNYDITIYKLIMLNILNIDFSKLTLNMGQEDKSKILDGLFYHLPLPSIILLKSDEGVHVACGEEILKALHDFIHNGFALVNCILRPELNGLKYDDKLSALHPKLRNYLTNIIAHCVVITSNKEHERDILKYYEK